MGEAKDRGDREFRRAQAIERNSTALEQRRQEINDLHRKMQDIPVPKPSLVLKALAELGPLHEINR